MSVTNLILNGDFQSRAANWTGFGIETNLEYRYLDGGSTTDYVSELDASRGTTVMEQQFTVDAPITMSLSFEYELRKTSTEGLEGFTVEVISVSDGSVIYSSGDIFPPDDNGASTTTQDFQASVTYPTSGDYILRFTEITLAGGGDGGGVIIDDVSMMVCFLKGTVIETSNGLTAIEDLKSGDLVETEHHGLQAIRWIGSTRVATKEKLYPVRISAGALGRNLPQRDLLVSRQHRIVVSSQIAERMFGSRDVLVAATKLTELPGIYEDKSFEQAEYFHMLFDRHEIVFAENTPVESLYTGPEALQAVPDLARAEILTLFPELENLDYTPEPALPIPANLRQKNLIMRHAKNNKSVLHAYSRNRRM